MRILRNNYGKGILASKNIADLLIHEGAHYKCFKNCQTVEDYRRFEERLRILWHEVPQEFQFFNLYVGSKQDGNELLAEAAVVKHQGGYLHPLLRALLESYGL